jgi:hypothetical protein
MENAALEIARMAEIIDQLTIDLEHESDARVAAEAHLLSMEDRLVELEQEVREECHADFEHRLALEMARWKATVVIEQERGEEHWDRKVEVLARGVGVATGDIFVDDEDEEEDKENVLIEDLEQENDRLRRELAVLKRELECRTPSRRAPLQERSDFVAMKCDMAGLSNKMEALRVGSGGRSGGDENTRKPRAVNTGSPVKRVRKLNTKHWESVEPDADEDTM